MTAIGRDMGKVIVAGNSVTIDDGTTGTVKGINGNLVVVTTEVGDVVIDLTVSNLEMQE